MLKWDILHFTTLSFNNNLFACIQHVNNYAKFEQYLLQTLIHYYYDN